MSINSLYHKLRRLQRNRKGIGTVFGMVFFLLIVMVVFASFMIILNQNTGLEQTVIQTRQMDQDRANEQLTITQQASLGLYSNIGLNSLNVNCILNNTGTLPIELVRLWVQDINASTVGNLALSMVLQQGNVTYYSSNNVTFPSNIQATDQFRFWFETARGNQFTLQQSNGNGSQNLPNEITNIISGVIGDFLPDYHSVEWGECFKVGSQYEVTSWTQGWIIPQSPEFNMVWRVNCTFKGDNAVTLDQNSMLFFVPSNARNPGGHALNPFMCYIVSETSANNIAYINPYPGNEITVLPQANITIYFGTQTPGYGSDTDHAFSNLIFGQSDASMMSLTIYGKSPSIYAQSFPLFAILPRVLRVTLSSYNDPVGTSITVTGAGFAPNSMITLRYDSNTIATSPPSLTSDSNGVFSASFTVPPSTAGNHVVNAIDAQSNIADATFTVTPSTSVSPGNGPIDTPVTISGQGFAASSTITITFGGTAISYQPVTDATGSFSGTFGVPSTAIAGNNTITAIDVNGNSASTFFMVMVPTISLNPGGAPVGTLVTITGSNFVPNSAITVTFDGTIVATTTASASGSTPSGVTFNRP